MMSFKIRVRASSSLITLNFSIGNRQLATPMKSRARDEVGVGEPKLQIGKA
jgi:hypothetical protein